MINSNFVEPNLYVAATLIDRLLGQELKWETINFDQIFAVCFCPSDETLSLFEVGLQIANYKLWVYDIGDDYMADKVSITVRANSVTVRMFRHQISPEP